MNWIKNLLTVAVVLATTATAFAAPKLMPAQCNDYPFKKTDGEVTHAQLMNELSELEAIGYHPDNDQDAYPGNRELAEKKLRAEYRRDCVQ